MSFVFRRGVLLVVLLLAAGSCDAQLLKDIFGGKERNRSKSTSPADRRTPANTTPKRGSSPSTKTNSRLAGSGKGKPAAFSYPATVKRSRYRIDVLASLYLNELVINGRQSFKDKIPEKAQAGISFCEGILLAADTLKALGYELDVYVHDIGDPSSTVESLIADSVFNETDLMIGAVQGNQVAALAAYAKGRRINFISALSPADGNIKDNPFFTLLQPALPTHCAAIREAVSKKQGRSRVILYHRTSVAVDDFAFKQISKAEGARFTPVLCDAMPAFNQLSFLFDSTETNTIIIPVIDAGYAAKLLLQLDSEFAGYRFEVYGLPSWKSMPLLKKQDTLQNISVTITEPFYYDPTTSAAQSLLGQYSVQYAGRPTDMVYRGYETLKWFAYLLQKYGTIYNTKIQDNAAAPFTQFEVANKMDDAGQLLYQENRHLYLMRYQGGMFHVDY